MSASRLVGLACFAGLGGFLFGYDLGLIGGALLGITEDLGIAGPGSPSQAFVVGAFKLGAFFGSFYGGAAMLRYGRRATIALNSVFTALGPLIMALSSNTAGLVAGRLVGGFGVGSCAIVVPVYLAEVAPTHHRGATVQVYEAMLCMGMLVAMLVNWALEGLGPIGWRLMVGLPAIPAAAMALALVLLPESPRWLVTRGKLDAARENFTSMHGAPTGSDTRVHASTGACPDGSGQSQDQDVGHASTEDLFLELLRDVELEQAGAQARRLQSKSGGDPNRDSADTCMEAEPLLTGNGTGPDHKHSLEMQRRPLNGGPDQHIVLAGGSSGDEEDTGEQLPRSWGATECKADESASAAEGLLSSSHSSSTSPGGWLHLQQPGTERTFMHTLAVMLSDIVLVAQGPERKAFAIAMWLAFFDQANASSAIINFAPSLMVWQGADSARIAMLLSASVPLTKTVGVLIGLVLVDRIGRRPLLIWGSAGSALAMTAMTAAAAAGAMAPLLAGMCVFILFFSASWAGLFWVLISELFSMSAKSPACSAATALLFLTGSMTNMAFMVLVKLAGPYAFLAFALAAALSGWYVWQWVPETRGRSVAEVQALLADAAGR